VNALPPTVLQKEILLGGQWSSLAQLAEACELSREKVLEAAVKGESGDTLFINYDRKVLDQKPQSPQLVSDQGNYSVWYKPSGTLSQGSKWSDHCTITETAASSHGKKCLLVHRLDRAARGLVLLAHTPNACKALAALFEKREVLKIYRATVYGKISGELPLEIKKPIDGKKALEIKKPIDGKKALTVVLSADHQAKLNQSELTVDIKTGRKHQIRDPDRRHENDLQLVAIELQFSCPFSGKLQKVKLDDSLLNTGG